MTDNEEIIFMVRKSWTNFIPSIITSILLIVVGITAEVLINKLGLFENELVVGNLGIIIGVILSLIVLISTFIRYKSVEFVVTKDKVITKQGLLSHDIYEISKRNIESIDIDQSFLGRILNYGTLELNGTGDEDRKIIKISKPVEFRKAAMN